MLLLFGARIIQIEISIYSVGKGVSADICPTTHDCVKSGASTCSSWNDHDTTTRLNCLLFCFLSHLACSIFQPPHLLAGAFVRKIMEDTRMILFSLRLLWDFPASHWCLQEQRRSTSRSGIYHGINYPLGGHSVVKSHEFAAWVCQSFWSIVPSQFTSLSLCFLGRTLRLWVCWIFIDRVDEDWTIFTKRAKSLKNLKESYKLCERNRYIIFGRIPDPCKLFVTCDDRHLS